MSTFVVLTTAFLTAATVTTGLLITKGVRLEMALPTPLELALKLRPFVVPTDPSHDPDPETLDRAIEELGGLSFLYRSLILLRAEAERRLVKDPDCRLLYERVIAYIREMRFLIIPLCFAESRFVRRFPSIPKVFLWTTARMYFELLMYLEGMPR